VRWYGVGPAADLSPDSHSLAFCLHGGSAGDRDLYVMVNAFWEPLTFRIQEGEPAQWRRVIDTGRPSPDDFAEPGAEPAVTTAAYEVTARSVVVLVR
jgi:glycogen operon protein